MLCSKFKGETTVTVMTTGHEKDRFTIMLCCTADGRKLPPYIVLKRKTMPKVTFPKGVIIRVQSKGWFDEEITKDWVKTVWARRDGGTSRKSSLLVLDAFRCHKSEPTKIVLQHHNPDIAIIPG